MTSVGENTEAPIGRKLHSLPPTYAPSLVFSHGNKYRDQTFCTILDQVCHVRSVPEMRGTRCIASSHGWLLLQSYYATDLCYLFDPIMLTKIQLPPVPYSSFHVGALTCSPTDSNCFVVLYSVRMRSFIFCRIGATHWVEKNLGREKKNRSLIHGTCKAVSCNEKIYLIFFDVIAVINVHDTSAFVKLYERPLELPLSYPGSVSLLEFFLEACGEVFEVVTVHVGHSEDIVRYCEVFKLDFSDMSFVKVDSIGDQIFLVGQCSESLSATGLGVKGNRIYILVPRQTIMYVFDMDDGTVTTSQTCLERIPHWGGPFWMVPNCKPQVVSPQYHKAEIKFEKSQGEVNRETNSWKDLQVELLELIMSSLPLGDCIRFRFTCKPWIPINPPVRSNRSLLDSRSVAQQLPWLMSFPNINKGLCTFHHPIYGDSFTMNIPELSNAVIVDAKYGWLLMLREETFFFFFNPFTEQIIELPELKYPGESDISFSSPPTSSDCIVFGHGSQDPSVINLLVYRRGKGSEDPDDEGPWERLPIYSDNKVNEFMASTCNPVYHDGVFYCLSIDGKLARFDPKETEEKLMWQVLPVRPVFSYTKFADFRKPIQSFILEHKGEILSVFTGFRGKPIWVYKLDRQEMKWVKLNSLGDKLVFLSPAGCMLLPAYLKGIQNRIYFSRFHDENNMFYSLSNGEYRCFKCVYCGENCKCACELLNCTWIQLSN